MMNELAFFYFVLEHTESTVNPAAARRLGRTIQRKFFAPSEISIHRSISSWRGKTPSRGAPRFLSNFFSPHFFPPAAFTFSSPN